MYKQHADNNHMIFSPNNTVGEILREKYIMCVRAWKNNLTQDVLIVIVILCLHT